LAVVLGLACALAGVSLTISPFASLAVLVLLVAIALLLTGLLELASASTSPARRVAVAGAAGWLAAGIAVLVWPGLTIRVLAVIAGVSLIFGGVVKALAEIRGTVDQRVTALVVGAASVIFGILSLSWPDVTVLVIAVVFGARIVLFGVTEVIAAATGRPAEPDNTSGAGRWPKQLRRWARAVAAVAALILAVALMVVSVRLHTASPRPDAFYNVPHRVPSTPGALLRSEPFSQGVPAAARAWRILYTTTRDAGVPAVASAIVLAATDIPTGPRPVVAWAHGTTGVARGCAPSLLTDPFGAGAMPGLDQVIARGWILVATDYTGLGTPGPHPYLIGQGEGRSVLDAVRAARQLDAVNLADRTVVWGHSQGGHAALWTGILAHGYAPDVSLVGVAALAPASNLPGLVDGLDTVRGGSIFASYVIQAYSDNYPDVRFGTYVRPTARIQVREMASRCLAAPEVFVSVATSLLFDKSIWAGDPTTAAAGRRLRENIPSGPIPAPLLIAQGETDGLITPAVQAEYVRQRCATGGLVDYRTYPGRDHVGLVAADSALIPDLLQWTQDRVNGKPANSTCTS
jgi:uncharacterized membrane protein HdeD (DUF308 family)